MSTDSSLIPAERIERRILLLRGQKVLLDFHLAKLYEVETKALNQAVKRNLERFPSDFMFQLTEEEAKLVSRSQIVTLDEEDPSQTVTGSGASASNSGRAPKSSRSRIVTSNASVAANSLNDSKILRSQFVTSKPGPGSGGRRHLPLAFTEQGVAMLSSVLRSPRAVQVNIAIMRTFVQLRQLLSSHADLARKLASLEQKYDEQFKVVFDAIRELMEPPTPAQKREIGFHTTRPERATKPGSATNTRILR